MLLTKFWTSDAASAHLFLVMPRYRRCDFPAQNPEEALADARASVTAISVFSGWLRRDGEGALFESYFAVESRDSE